MLRTQPNQYTYGICSIDANWRNQCTLPHKNRPNSIDMITCIWWLNRTLNSLDWTFAFINRSMPRNTVHLRNTKWIKRAVKAQRRNEKSLLWMWWTDRMRVIVVWKSAAYFLYSVKLGTHMMTYTKRVKRRSILLTWKVYTIFYYANWCVLSHTYIYGGSVEKEKEAAKHTANVIVKK